MDVFQIAEIPIPPGANIGRLIGKKGANIGEISARSGSRINVDSENGVVRVRGTASAIAKAREIIADQIGGDGVEILDNIDEFAMMVLSDGGFLDSLKQNGVTISVSERQLKVKTSPLDSKLARDVRAKIEERLQGGGQKIEVSLNCNPSVIQTINDDEGIKRMRDSFGLKVETKKTDSGTAVVLKGPSVAVKAAQESIELLSKSNTARIFLPVITNLLACDNPKKVADLMEDIRLNVERKYGVVVSLKDGHAQAIIEGAPEAASYAKEELEQVLEYYFPQNCAALYIQPYQALTEIAGEKENKMVRLARADLSVLLDNPTARIWLCGKPDAVNWAVNRIESDYSRWQDQNIIIEVDPKLTGYIIGPRGQNLRQLQEASGATISCEDGVVHIRGDTRETTLKGKLAVEEHIRRRR